MLSNFIRWSGKRKVAKANDDRSRQPSPSPPLSPMVFHTEEESASSSDVSSPLSVDIDISQPNESWSHQETLRSSSCSPGSSVDRYQRTKQVMHLTGADASPTPRSLRSEDTSPRPAARKKSIPAPILIPGVEICIPNIQIGRSPPPPAPTQPNPNNTSINPPSPSPSDNHSSISGTTFAHAMIASTFVLTSSERRASRHRSGNVRQDSATLPRRESCLVYNSARSSVIPPVPPVPAMIAGRPPSPHLPSIMSGASTESEYPLSDAYITSPEIATSPEISGQISHTLGASSQTVVTSSEAPSPAVPNTSLEGQTGLTPGCLRAFKDNLFDVPRTAVDIPLPVNVQETTSGSSLEGSSGVSPEDHSLDEFDFVPPEPLAVIGSPGSESSASYTTPLLRRRSDAKWRRRFAGSNFVRNGIKDQSEGIALCPGPSIPSATASEHDYGELFNCELTVSPGSSSSSHFLSSGSAGYQTFPETPMGFSPLWSPLYALLAKSDNQVLRRRPPTPAGLGPRMLYCGMRSSRLQAECGVLRRSRSPLFPKQEVPSPGQPKSGLSALVQINDTQGVSEDLRQVLPTIMVESHNSQVFEAHPLAPASYLSEEGAHVRRSPLPLPSDDAGAPLNSLPISAPIIDPASIPLPESATRSSSSSPALNAMITLPTSALYSPPPSSTTAVSQASPSKLSLSDSLHEESFQPSSSPPLDAPFPRTLSPTAIVPSLFGSDCSISPSTFPPPPYHAVVSERIAYHTSSPPTSPASSSDLDYQRSRHVNSLRGSGTVRSRGRARPPLPIGPRKPSGHGQVFGSFSSVSSTGSSEPGSPWTKLQSAASKPPPKFQMPPPKWRGLTLEAARWTFTSAQLQEVVSRALQQSSEGSSIRLLRLEVLEGEIADEMHRLELQHTDVKAQYRTLVRKRWALMGAIATQMEGREACKAVNTMEALVEVMAVLDQLADRMHDIVLEMSQINSLHDVHNASALALAVRKINGVFVRQVAEKERLQEHVEALKTERDEAWKHAEDIAKDYDSLNDRISEVAVRAGGDATFDDKRATHISAVRKSTNRLSQAGLRSRSRHRPSRRSSTATRPASLAMDGVVPPLPRLSVNVPDAAAPTGMSLGSVYSYASDATEALALAEAQREVYEMLGLSPPSQTTSPVNRRRLSVPDSIWRPPRRRPRPASESLLARVRPRSDRARVSKSVMFDDISNRLALTVM